MISAHRKHSALGLCAAALVTGSLVTAFAFHEGRRQEDVQEPVHLSRRTMRLVREPIVAANRVMQASGGLEWHAFPSAGRDEIDDLLRRRKRLRRNSARSNLRPGTCTRERLNHGRDIALGRNLEIGGKGARDPFALASNFRGRARLELRDVD